MTEKLTLKDQTQFKKALRAAELQLSRSMFPEGASGYDRRDVVRRATMQMFDWLPDENYGDD